MSEALKAKNYDKYQHIQKTQQQQQHIRQYKQLTSRSVQRLSWQQTKKQYKQSQLVCRLVPTNSILKHNKSKSNATIEIAKKHL